MALHALELKDGGGPEGALFVGLCGIVRYGLEAGQLGGPGIRLLPCPAHAQDDDVLGEDMLGQDEVKHLESRASRARRSGCRDDPWP